jgi:uncharacterized membrane protein
MPYLNTLHLFAAALWIGGMFFSLFILRPVCLRALEGPARLMLMIGVMSRFFGTVWLLVPLLLLSGFGMLNGMNASAGAIGWHVILMLVIGLTMAAIFIYAFFIPFRRARQAYDIKDGATTGKQLEIIRKLVITNFGLSLILVLAGGMGRFF